MLKLYGQYRSRAFRVCWLLKESNIPYEHVNVTINVPNATAKEDWYRGLNPNARVPTIDDDGFVMWESAAINFYLAEKYKSPLLPPDMANKGRALQWDFFISNDEFADMIEKAAPNFVNIGADSKGHGLVEPSMQKVNDLITRLQHGGIEIRQKKNLDRLKGR